MKVLDKGYIEVVETWGSDERIIEAARMSTGKGFKGWGGPLYVGDEKLLRYLWENNHQTPFEMAGMIIEVKAPICVFREWHRHRTQSYNEMSARYTPLPDEDYVPSRERLLISGGANKQASGTGASLTAGQADLWLSSLESVYQYAQEVYAHGLSLGVPKELARLCLPVARYSRMRASANLRNWLGFCALRSTAKNPHAQWEIRQYADALTVMLAKRFPRTLQLFNE